MIFLNLDTVKYYKEQYGGKVSHFPIFTLQMHYGLSKNLGARSCPKTLILFSSENISSKYA